MTDNKNSIEKQLTVVCDKLKSEIDNKKTKHPLFSKFDVKDFTYIILLDAAAIVYSIKSLLKYFTLENGSFSYSNNISIPGTIAIGFVAITTISFLVYSIIACIIQTIEKKDAGITSLYKDNFKKLKKMQPSITELKVKTEKSFDDFADENLHEYDDKLKDDYLIGYNDICNNTEFLKMLLRCSKNAIDANESIAIRNKTHLLKLVAMVKNKLQNNILCLDIQVKCDNIPKERKDIYIDSEELDRVLSK